MIFLFPSFECGPRIWHVNIEKFHFVTIYKKKLPVTSSIFAGFLPFGHRKWTGRLLVRPDQFQIICLVLFLILNSKVILINRFWRHSLNLRLTCLMELKNVFVVFMGHTVVNSLPVVKEKSSEFCGKLCHIVRAVDWVQDGIKLASS
jgi:hypothetical protein